ncbi:hypothetical protein J4Q44_G00341260 [Coregonus suidteri]|uniref:Uncharacterized protein n=1 Tax=Coregonus suidteri TaxID=861788 RepID=A0AAN8KT96_9TELE
MMTEMRCSCCLKWKGNEQELRVSSSYERVQKGDTGPRTSSMNSSATCWAPSRRRSRRRRNSKSKKKKKKKTGEGEFLGEGRPCVTKIFAKFSHDAPLPMLKKKHLTVEQLSARRRKVWLTIGKKECPKAFKQKSIGQECCPNQWQKAGSPVYA